MPATFATIPATMADTHRGQHGRQCLAILRADVTAKSGCRDHLPAADRAAAQGHKTTPRRKPTNRAHRARKWRSNIGIAPRIKTPCRGVKMENRAYNGKAPGTRREQRETPHSVSHAGQGYF